MKIQNGYVCKYNNQVKAPNMNLAIYIETAFFFIFSAHSVFLLTDD